jgi:hypothetical protein
MDQPQQDRATAESSARYAALRLDREAYRPFVEGQSLTADQEDMLLEAVWLIVVGVVDLGFDFPATADHQLPLAADSSAVISFIQSQKIEKHDAAESFSEAGEDDS